MVSGVKVAILWTIDNMECLGYDDPLVCRGRHAMVILRWEAEALGVLGTDMLHELGMLQMLIPISFR